MSAKGTSCRLCLKQRELQDSHLLSAGLYRRIVDPTSPNPVFVSEEVTMETSKQIRAFAFCYDCEQRMNRNGEDWVLRNIFQRDGKRFPLRDKLRLLTPSESNPKLKL